MKAQFWSLDLVSAMLIFTSAVVLLTLVWISVNNQFAVVYGYGVGAMQTQLNGLVQTIQSPGAPADWYSQVNISNPATWSNVSAGLGTSGNGSVISRQKLLTLVGMSNSNYQDTKRLLGISYDYYVTISSPSEYNVSIGLDPNSRNPTAIQTATVPVTLDNGETATMRVLIWTNTSFGVS